MLRRPSVDPESKTYKFKICLVGEEGVGKTSLIHRFVSGAFDESYIRTLGAVVSKKTVALGSMGGHARGGVLHPEVVRMSDPLHVREVGRERRGRVPRPREDDRRVDRHRVDGRNHHIGTAV